MSMKVKVTLPLEENGLWDIVKDVVALSTDLQLLVAHKKKEVTAKQIIMDAIKYHLIHHASEQKMSKDIFDALLILYQSENNNQKIILHKLRSIEMIRPVTVTSYLIKATQIYHQIATVGEKIEDKELVNKALNGFPPQWETFVQGVCPCENIPNQEILWVYYIQEET